MNEHQIEDSYPISPLQKGMLFHSLYAPQSGLYIPQMIWTLQEDLNVSAFKHAWEQVVKRHPILRTSFHWEGLEEPLQKVHQQVDLPLIQEDWRGLSVQEQESRLETYLHTDLRQDFELTKAPIMRLALFQISETDYQFIWTYHHALFDGHSRLLIVKEIFAYYEAFCQGHDLKLKQPRPYRDHIERLQQQNLSKAKAFWQETLKGFSGPTRLIQDQVTDSILAREKVDGSEQEITLSKAETSALKSLAKQHGLTLNTVLQGAWVLLLSRYSGSEDVVFGATRACRHSTVKEAKDIVGLFINMLPIRVQVSPEMLLIPWLEKLRAQWIAMREYEQTSHLKIQEWSDLPPGTPLFENIHDFRYSSVESALCEQGGNWKKRKFRVLYQSNVPLAFAGFGETELLLKIEYNRRRFDDRTIARMLGHYQGLLEGMVADPEQRISDMTLLTETERQQLLVGWNDTATDYPRDKCIHELIEEQVERSPDNVAVVFEGQQLTYRQLNERANQLAHHLLASGLEQEAPVGIFVERSFEMLIGLLGILKAGGAYVPLDPNLPKGRLAFILEDTRTSFLITQQRLVVNLPARDAKIISLDTAQKAIARESKENPVKVTRVENIAYIIYTSGSTGQPKGVLIPHQALVNHSNAVQKRYNIRPLDRVLQFAPFNFDVAAEELYPSLLRGARIVLREDDSKSSLSDFFQFVRKEELSILNLPSSFWHELVSWLSQTQMGLPLSLRLVIVGSDVTLSEQLLAWQQIAGDSVRLLNAYGPTEATITATLYDTTIDVRNRQAYSIPIGRPISNTLVYVLDASQQPVPIGVAGELHIGGDGLARGYLNRPELTAEKFIPDPFSEKVGARLYKTGDLVRYLSDGNLEFLGRIDHQVKVRGYRIEPGEIESVLGRHAAVEETVVIAREDVPGEKRLVGYVVPAQEPVSPSVLRRYLQQRIPNYMVPAHFVMLDALPLTPIGKVDRRDLPTPDGVRPELDTAYQAPLGGVEKTLTQIWKQVLRIDQVGRQDNFFELGGDSILSIQIGAKANQAGLRVTPRHLFQYQTIAELAEVVEALEPVAADQGLVTGPLPLSPIQHWFFGQQFEEPNHWNMAWVLEAKQPVDPEKMEQVVESLLRHHDALRLRFVPHSTGWEQELGAPNQPAPFTFIDLSHLPYAEAGAAFSQEAGHLHTTLNLSEGPLIGVALFKFSENQADRLLLVIHHLAVDGISWRILLDDLQTAYDQLCESGSIQLPPKTTSYKDWTEGLVEYAQSNKLHEEISYWEAVANTPCTPLPRDFVDGVNTVASTRMVSVGLGPEDTRALLQEIPEVYHTRINDVLLAALVDALTQWSRQETICLNLEGHGREELLEDIDLSRTVGWFTSIFPMVLKRGTPGHAGELLKSVKEQLRQIPHRGIGYGLLRYLSEDGKVRDHLGDGLDPELSFNYLGQFDQVIAVDGQWRWSEASGGANRNTQARQTDLISINARVMNSVLQVQWSYSEAVHRRETIENLSKNYLSTLVTIIRHCQSTEAGGHTPSDFPIAKVSQPDLDKALIGMKSGDGQAVLADLYPLTPLQQGLWFHALVNPESGVYFEQSVLRVEGFLNRDVFRRAWEEVLARHAILRTGIFWEGLENPLQLVRSTVKLPWVELDWRESPDTEHPSRLLKFLDEDRLRGFDLTQAPLMRLTLIQIAETSAILVWSFHHLILDRWSVDLVQQEVWSVYQALVQGQPLQFNALRPYREYIGWLQDQDLNRAEQYWRQLLSGFTAPTVLGVDQAPSTRVGHQESLYDFEEITLSEAATSALSRWARQQQLTVNTVVQGAWALLLSRYSGSEDVVFGATVSGRSAGLPGIESMVGLFINTLPVRVHVSSGHCVVPWLTELQKQQVTLREYEYTPLYEIQKWCEVPAEEPLFNTLLVFENITLESGGNFLAGAAELNVQRVPGIRGGETNYPLTVAVIPGRTLQVLFTYDTEHYTAKAITRMVGHFQQVLTGMIGDREQTLLGAIPLLTEAEHQQMLVEWNATETTYPREDCIHDLFEAQVEQTPDAVALVYGEDTLTYDELNTRANQLAHHLRKRGVGPEAMVGMCMERSIEMIVGLIGILKAGGTYVPLDPEYPKERLAFILQDTAVPVLLTQQRLLEALPECGAEVICLDANWDIIAKEKTDNLVSEATAENLAYVIYTSGSTGKPKGVLVTHVNVMRLMKATEPWYSFDQEDVWTLFHSYAFDFSVWEIWGALLYGARLVIVPYEVSRSPNDFYNLMMNERVTILNQTPSAFYQLIQAEETIIPKNDLALRLIIFGGEALELQSLKPWFKRHGDKNPQLVNMYGITETTVHVTYRPITNEDVQSGQGSVIGERIPDLQLYVLDGNLQPVPIGVAGELFVGGAGLARGYLNRPDLTVERFIPDPFNNKPGARLYKTGDVARYISNGDLEYLGRADQQVQIRGFRVEPGEIEVVLAGYPGVNMAVVMAREDRPGDKRLVAYVVTSHESIPTFGELRSFLKEKLPEYMIPSAFMFLDSLPLTPNGKVDRNALPTPDHSRPELESKFVEPRTPVEDAVAEIWRDSLGLEQVGIHDNFFDLGGHSLLATKIVSRLKTTFAVDISLRSFFDSSTIAGVSATLAMARRGEKPTENVGILPVARNGSLPLSFAQERFWVLDQFHTDSTVFNCPFGFRLRGPLQFQVFRESVQALVDRHEILRTMFASVDGGPFQVIAPTLSVEVPLQNCSDLSKEEQAGMIQQVFLEERRFPFDLAHGPLFRARLLRFAEDDHFLMLNLHHIIHDAWSLEVIIKDLVTAYTAGCAGHTVTWPALPIQYADYAHWQRKLLEGPIGRKQLAFWKTQLAQLPPALPLPTDYARPAVQTFRGAREDLQLSAEVMAPLRALNRQEGTTLFMVLLATLQFHLHRLTGTDDILVGSPIAGRDQKELHGLTGCFLNTLVLRTDLSSAYTGRDLLQRVREVVLNAYENQDVPFEKILAEVDPSRDPSRTPIFQVMLNMHSFDDELFPLPELSVTRYQSTDIKSLFDMTLYFIESTDEIQLSLYYNADLFTAGRMTEFMRQFQSILEQMVNDPDQPLEAFSLVTSSARLYLPDPSALLTEPLQTSMIEMFNGWVKQTPEQPALSTGDQTLTYEKLFKRTQILARILRLNGLERGDVVAVYGPRSFGLIVNMMAVFLSGGVLLPVDSNLPRRRQQLILQEAGAKFLLYIRGREFEGAWWEQDLTLGVQPLEVDTNGLVRADPDVDLDAVSLPESGIDDAAYIFFTSGTTGVPKGVLGSHKGLNHFLNWQRETFDITPEDRVAHLTSFSFDPVLREIFLPLTSGATLCLPEDIDILAANDVLSWLDRERISVLHTVPSLAQSWLTNSTVEVSLNAMRWVFFAGESLTENVVSRWQSSFPRAEIVNLYGPAETTLAKCFYQLSSGVHQGVQPLGRPMPQTQALVLSRANQLCAIGEPGEVVLRTPFRSKGYINNHEENRKRFVKNPFRDDEKDQLYYTGDRGRYRPDGMLEFLGRLDDQVKIRGVRVEPNEVTVTLARHPEVDSCFVTNKRDEQRQPRLVAYVVLTKQSKTTVTELRAYLKKQLPATMVPEAFVFLTDLPLTTRGKVDRLALPVPDERRPDIEASFAAPRNAVEEALAEIWGEVLRIEKVGIQDNFFELGGHSLMATQIISRLFDVFQVVIPLRQLFLYPTIAELALIIAGKLEKTEQENVEQLLDEFEDLSDEEAERLLAQELRQNERENRSV